MTLRARSAGLGVVVLVLALAATLGFYAKVHASPAGLHGVGTAIVAVLALSAVLACGVGVVLLPKETVVQAAAALRFTTGAHPYRQGPPAAREPSVSARVTACVMLACMTFTAMVVPFALHLPRWLEVEGVLGMWWLSWAAVLAVLAYRGRPLDEGASALWHGDDTSPAPAPVPGIEKAPRPRWWLLADLCFNGEGVAIVLALVLALGVAWLVVELVAPAVFFATWLGVTHALGRARESRHHGDLVRSTLHGAVWATAYVAPLAVVIAIVHAFAALR